MEVQGTSIMEHANFSQQQVTLNISLLPAVKHTVYLKKKNIILCIVLKTYKSMKIIFIQTNSTGYVINTININMIVFLNYDYVDKICVLLTK